MPDQIPTPEVPNGKGPESPKAPAEQQEGGATEQVVETTPAKKKGDDTAVAAPAAAQPPAAAVAPPAQKSETLERIEDIMEEDLKDVYSHLTPDKKQEFRKKGEETAEEIETMMYKVKIKSKKIFDLLFGWMKIIPGVNRYFLKQEAKIKTDDIMHVKDEIDKSKHGSMDM